MANSFTKFFTFLMQGKRSATCNEVTLTTTSGDAPLIGPDGQIGHSNGTIQVSISIKEVTPVGGSGFIDILRDAMLKKKYVEYSCLHGGMWIKGSARVMQCALSSEAQGGTATGTLELQGGKYEVIG